MIAGAFPVAGAGLKVGGKLIKDMTPTQFKSALRNIGARVSLGKEATDTLKTMRGNAFAQDALAGKINAGTVANEMVERLRVSQNIGKKKLASTRSGLLNKEVIPSDSVVRSAYDAIRTKLRIPDGTKITKEVLEANGLNPTEANVILRELRLTDLRSGKPLSKISPARLDEIIQTIDKTGAFEKTDSGSAVIRAIRQELNKKLPSGFKSAKEKASKQIKQQEKDVRNMFGLSDKKVLEDELSNADQVTTKIQQLVNAYLDQGKKANTIKAIKAFDKRNGTQFLDKIEALGGARLVTKAMDKSGDAIKSIATGGVGAGLIASAFSGGASMEDAFGGLGVAGIIAVLRSQKARQEAIKWVLESSPATKKEAFKAVPELREALRVVTMEMLGDEELPDEELNQ